MIKLIWIGDDDFKGIVFKFLFKICDSKIYDSIGGTEAENLITVESVDFLYLAIKGPANTDTMQRLSLRNINGLRVSVFKFTSFKSKILNFLFPAEIIKIIAYRFLGGSQSSSEKFIISH
jgi:hypothetical protein